MTRSPLTAAPTLIFTGPQTLPPLSRLALTVAQTLLTWDLRRQGRRGLRGLDAHLLRDIGLTEDAAWAEGEKPFWQA